MQRIMLIVIRQVNYKNFGKIGMLAASTHIWQ